jgi:hypothetical protein
MYREQKIESLIFVPEQYAHYRRLRRRIPKGEGPAGGLVRVFESKKPSPGTINRMSEMCTFRHVGDARHTPFAR